MFAEPIQITNHPASQEKKEGARVKLKCKAQGKKKVFYQWLKDGTKMRGQNGSTLALDSVELCDFGFYSCQVRYADSHGRGVSSYPAIVDIAPRDGLSKYCVGLRPNGFSKHHPTWLKTTLLQECLMPIKLNSNSFNIIHILQDHFTSFSMAPRSA